MSDDGRNEMKRVSHTHPHTGETFGTVYERGPAVTDGGRSDGDRADRDAGSETMRDVDHTPPHGDEGAADVWARGRTRITDAATAVAADGDEPVSTDVSEEDHE